MKLVKHFKHPKKLSRVTVYWDDACSSEQRWVDPCVAMKRARLAKCETTGYLLYKSSKCVVVCMNIGWDHTGKGSAVDEVAETHAIPRGCVTRIKRLK